MEETIVAVFDSRAAAERAANQIKQAGDASGQISIVGLAKDEGQDESSVSDGTVTGGTIGGIAGLFLGMSSIMIPGLGLIAAAGPIAGLLTGTVTGGIVGSLIDLGISPESSEEYQNDVLGGAVLFSMPIHDENGGKVSKTLKQCGARKVELHR